MADPYLRQERLTMLKQPEPVNTVGNYAPICIGNIENRDNAETNR